MSDRIVQRKELPGDPLAALALLLEAQLNQVKRQLILRYAPHDKQYLWHQMGQDKQIRAFFGGNRTGKTVAGAIETAFHLTGMYPDWWPGVRWATPTRCWACSETAEVTRDVAQRMLMGRQDSPGTGIIPGNKIGKMTTKRGVAGALDIVRVKHRSGGWSELGFKAYDQKRKKFQGTSRHWIWDDEEPPLDVYDEQKMRIMDTEGQIGLTLTPLEGMTDVCMQIIGDPPDPMTGYVTAQWSDNPHLAPHMIEEFEKSVQPHEREARQYGKPILGKGKVYPFSRAMITYRNDFEIPKYWHHGCAWDFGYTDPTAILWGVYDPNSDILYIYSEHCVAEQPPIYHAAAWRGRNPAHMLLPSLADPSGGREEGIKDRESYFKAYEKLGVHFTKANNAIEAGIAEVYQRFVSGRLKIAHTLGYTLSEFDFYHRNEKGKPVGGKDHLMDCLRYLVMGINQLRPITDTGKVPIHKKRLATFSEEYGGH